MLAVDFNKMGNIESKVVQFPINRVKKVDNIGKSTKMWCLKDREEIHRRCGVCGGHRRRGRPVPD